jgi:hypothetical protein
MKPRILLFIDAIIVIVAVIVFVIFFSKIGGNSSTVDSTVGGGNAISIAQAYPDAPTGTTFTIGTPSGTVQVKNFYTAANTQLSDDGVLVIAQTSDYLISYDPTNSSFWVGISGTPFATVRPEAEAAFLSALGVSKSDACKLSVSVGVPYAAGNSMDGQSSPLSFCE